MREILLLDRDFVQSRCCGHGTSYKADVAVMGKMSVSIKQSSLVDRGWDAQGAQHDTS